ncbi:MAG: methyltransferase domain-containing protein [Patescibacteria group bacterium]|nr:methyltransferase domain-containing protein [Patescibacteria group bacterium]
MSQQDEDGHYSSMWEDFAKLKAESYLNYKFKPTHRIGLTNHLREASITNLLKPQKQDRVLDAGCASGRQLFQVANLISEGHGTDIASAFTDKATEYACSNNIGNLEFQRAVLESIPYPDAYFDKIICAEVLEHVFDKNIALTELKRVLKPGGKLIITVPNLNADGTLWGRLLRLIGLRSFTPLEGFSMNEINKHGDAHVREFNAKTLSGWLESNGFTVEKIRSVSFIDGPYFDFLLKMPLHWGPTQKTIIALERLLSSTGLFWGRHLAARAKLDIFPPVHQDVQQQ